MPILHHKRSGILLVVWSFLRNISYLFVIFILAFILFNGTGQSVDFMLAFKDKSEINYYISVAILLFFWSYITWYSASIILQITPVNFEFINDKLAERSCLAAGFIPSFIMSLTFFIGHAFYWGLASVILGILFLLFFKWLNNSNKWRKRWPLKEDIYKHSLTPEGFERTPTFMEEIRFIRKYPDVVFYFRTIGIFFVCLIILRRVVSCVVQRAPLGMLNVKC